MTESRSKHRKNHMLVWSLALAMTVLLGVLPVVSLVFEAFGVDKTGLSASIFVLFLLGLLVSFVACKRIHNDGASLKAIKESMGQGDLGFRQILVARNALKKLPPTDLGRLFSEGSPDSPSFPALYEDSKQSTQNLAGLFSTVLVSLGLVGTVAGLITSMGGMTGIMDSVSGSGEGLAASFSQTMGGLSTAFFTTLVGALLGGVVLRVLGGANSHGIECIAGDLQILQHQLESVKTPLDVELASLVESVTSASAYIDTVFRHVGEQITESGNGLAGRINGYASSAQFAMEQARVEVTALNDQLSILSQATEDASGALVLFTRSRKEARFEAIADELSQAAQALRRIANPDLSGAASVEEIR